MAIVPTHKRVLHYFARELAHGRRKEGVRKWMWSLHSLVILDVRMYGDIAQETRGKLTHFFSREPRDKAVIKILEEFGKVENARSQVYDM
ncbi:MAG TPA: hypothetical protein VJJ73_00275 [Candidatus Paceibacterota bacterium]